MKKQISIYIIFFICLIFPALSQAETKTPLSLGGFTLGENVSRFEDLLKMETSLPPRYMKYINEVEVKPVDGFKTGLIWYGNCREPNQVIRIMLKYSDTSKKFYKKLYELFEEKFGEPSEWKGDAFHIVLAWKWSFVDKNNNKLSLILQHNTKDSEQRKGNSIKMTLTNLLEEENLCYAKKSSEVKESSRKKGEKKKKTTGKTNWNQFIPQ